MTEIKRFDMRGNTWPSDDGSIVSYKDHAAIVAALQEQVRALSAECKAVYAHALEEGYQFYPGGIEYTDAFIRDIRAQAVEGFAEHIAFYHYDSKSHALDFAARIREGEQP